MKMVKTGRHIRFSVTNTHSHVKMSKKFSGKLSWSEFLIDCTEFLRVSEHLNDGWISKNIKKNPQVVVDFDCYYLEKKIIKSTDFSSNDSCLNEELNETDDKSISVNCSQHLTYEFHIVYSIAYSTPVLYFLAWKQDGRMLNLQELWEHMPLMRQGLLNDRKWSTISQQEHPILCRPFYLLHPCHTSELMVCAHSSLDGATCPNFNYILTWLSTVGPMVGLEISTDYCKLIRKRGN